MIKHSIEEEVMAKSANPITQEMAQEGEDSRDGHKFVGLGESGIRDDAPKFGRIGEDAPNKFVGGDFRDASSEIVGGTEKQQARKRKNGETGEASQPAEKEGMNKDKKYRAKQKAAKEEMEKEKKDLKAKVAELEGEIVKLNCEKVGLEKQVLELKVEKEKAVGEKERAEKKSIQKELDNANQNLQTPIEEGQSRLLCRLFQIPVDSTMDGSLLFDEVKCQAYKNIHEFTLADWRPIMGPSRPLTSLQSEPSNSPNLGPQEHDFSVALQGQPEMQLAFSQSPNSASYTFESEGSHQLQAFNPTLRNSFTMKEFLIPYNGENGWSQTFPPASVVPDTHLANDDISDAQMPNWFPVNTAWDLGQPEMQLAFSQSPNSASYTFESEGSHQLQAFNPTLRNSFTMKEFLIPYNGENGWSQTFPPASIIPSTHLANDDISDAQMPNWSLVNTWDLGNGFRNESHYEIPFPNIKRRASWCRIRAAIKWWSITRAIDAEKIRYVKRCLYVGFQVPEFQHHNSPIIIEEAEVSQEDLLNSCM